MLLPKLKLTYHPTADSFHHCNCYWCWHNNAHLWNSGSGMGHYRRGQPVLVFNSNINKLFPPFLPYHHILPHSFQCDDGKTCGCSYYYGRLCRDTMELCNQLWHSLQCQLASSRPILPNTWICWEVMWYKEDLMKEVTDFGDNAASK